MSSELFRCGVCHKPADSRCEESNCPFAAPPPRPHLAEVTTLYETNMRDPVATLRKIADDIEAGVYGEVGTVGVALIGDTMECFGGGSDSEAPSVGLLFHAAFSRMSNAIESHGK